MSLRPSWSTELVPGQLGLLHREIQSRKTKPHKTKKIVFFGISPSLSLDYEYHTSESLESTIYTMRLGIGHNSVFGLDGDLAPLSLGS